MGLFIAHNSRPWNPLEALNRVTIRLPFQNEVNDDGSLPPDPGLMSQTWEEPELLVCHGSLPVTPSVAA